jgi:predicted nucleotidyltransferase
MGYQFPDHWRHAIVVWARSEPLIAAVYLFGSRAKGCARIDSDIDLAYQTHPDGSETSYTVAFFNGDVWRRQLQDLLPVPVDLQYADPADDRIVWPAVKEHGIRLL